MSLQRNMLDIFEKLRNDEKLIRLLTLPARDDTKGIKEPLDQTLPDVLDKSSKSSLEINEIKDDVIYKIPKIDDLEDRQICRIYAYPGKRRSNDGNFLYADQTIVFDLIVHESFEKGDLRSARIIDRLDEMFTLKNISGIGKMIYLDGDPIAAPKNYIGYKHLFKIVEANGGH